jgi:hypothetical protein
MIVSNLQYEITKLISDSKEYIDTDSVVNKVMSKDKESVKVKLSSLYGKYGQKG